MNKNTKAALCILTEYGMGFRLIDKNTMCTVHDGPFEEPLTQLVSATKRTVVISTISPFKVDEGSQVMLREFITDRNTGIAIGGFFIDEGSGSFGFKSGIYTGGREVTEDELMYHSGIGISSVRDAVDYWENTTPLCSAVGTMGLQRNRTGSNPGSQETPRQEEGHDDSARWSSKEEFLRGLDSAPLDFSEPMSAGGFPLGVFDGRVYFDTGDSHTIVFGSTGSKKTLSVSMPAIRIIAHSGESAVVLDPKGDQLRAMGRELVSLGYPVYVVNARDPSRSHRWNMLRLPYELSRSDDFGDRDMAQNLVANLAEVLSPVVDKDPYWNMSAQSLIVGLCSVLFNVCSDPLKIT